MEKKDLSANGAGEGNLFYGYEEMNSTALTIKEEMYSDISSEVNDSDQVCTNDSETPFCFVGIKMENPDDYESEASSANSELSNMSYTKIKMECEEGIDSRKSDNISVTIDTNKDCDSKSVVCGCDMGQLSTEFIRGIECQKYPILRMTIEQGENTIMQIAPNSRILSEPEDLDDSRENEMTINSSHDGNSSRLMLMEASDEVEKVSLRAVYPPPPTETATEASAIPRSGFTQVENCGERIEMMQGTGHNSSLNTFCITKKQKNHILSGTSDSESGSLKIHKLTHDSKKAFECEISKKSFTESGALNNHIRVHSQKKPFNCEICRKAFGRLDHLKTHNITHTGEKLFECKICRKAFGRHEHLKKHTVTHTGEKPYECEICKKSYTERSTLKKHILTHTGVKPFECKICRKAFGRYEHLKEHKITHTGEKLFECEICRKAFGRHGNLKKHTVTHTGEKPYECEICKKSYTERGTLKKHILTHTGEKPFECETCKKSFYDRVTLKNHILIHTGDKPFECEICKKSYIYSSGLKRHMLTHTGVKPFECEICRKSFTQGGSLKYHILTQHSREKPV